jgi:serine/threonine protein kinase
MQRERIRSCGRISLGLHETYSIECEAGRGMYGVVYKGLHREQNKFYAIKKFKPMNSKETDGISLSACREILVCCLVSML